LNYKIDGSGERLDEKCFSQTWNAAHQAMTARHERGEDLPDHGGLPDDGAGPARGTERLFLRHLQ
jgi:hypothetical protein